MTVHSLLERLRGTLAWIAALSVLIAPQLVWAQPPPVCSSGCVGSCTLTYNADGVLSDNVTGMPIAGAQITLLDVVGTSAVDGSYSVSGAQPSQCHFDYFFSMSVTAPGYEPFSNSGYWTGINLDGYDIRLNPVSPTGGHVVSGIVAEFPSCTGAMRGVTVVLEPLNLTTTTSSDAVGGGRFAFRDVPPGDYTIRVAEGCNPFGCWEVDPVRVGSDNVDLAVCMTATGPSPSPTATPTAGPSATFTVCPVKTPCVLGERPQFCEEHCGVGCGCEQCPECPAGFISEPRVNACECIPDPDVTPPPTPTRTSLPCLFPTPPLCPIGQTANCPHVPCGATDAGCFCETCPPCPDGFIYGGGFNSCACVDPRTFTVTPTPDFGTSPTPTPNVCAFATPPLCPVGQAPHCVSNDCSVGCGCEACDPCPDGLVYSGEINRCECVDANAPTRTPTPTPDSRSTPPSCPTRTPLACGPDESTVCDTSVDPCGVCECRAVPQQPSNDSSSLNPSAGGGCGIVTSKAESSSWSWPLLLLVAIAWRHSRPRTTDLSR